jgi:hypothetical protein
VARRHRLRDFAAPRFTSAMTADNDSGMSIRHTSGRRSNSVVTDKPLSASRRGGWARARREDNTRRGEAGAGTHGPWTHRLATLRFGATTLSPAYGRTGLCRLLAETTWEVTREVVSLITAGLPPHGLPVLHPRRYQTLRSLFFRRLSNVPSFGCSECHRRRQVVDRGWLSIDCTQPLISSTELDAALIAAEAGSSAE